MFEWCSDWYDGKLRGGVDPIGPERKAYRVLRGGSWRGSRDSCRSGPRIFFGPSDRDDYLGFRVARSQSVQ